MLNGILEKRWIKVGLASIGALAIGTIITSSYYWIRTGGDFDTLLPQIRLILPGEHEVFFAKSGLYAVFHEYVAVTDSADYSSESIPYVMTVRVMNLEQSEYMNISQSNVKVRYEHPGRAGVSLLEFDVPLPGRYRIEGFYDNGSKKPHLMFAFGPIDEQISIIFYHIAIFLGGCMLGLFIMLRVLKGISRRGRSN